MIFDIDKDALLEGLSKSVPIAEKKSTLPILSHVLLKASEDKLVLSATDLEVGIEIYYDCRVEEPGTIALPGRKFFEIIRELAPGPVRLKLRDNQRMEIISGVSAFQLAGMKADDFPVFMVVDDVQSGTAHSSKLAEMIEKTMFAASNDESRFNLNAVLIEFDENGTTMVATDGHRLATIHDEGNFGLKGSPLAPKKGLHELKRLIESLDTELSIGFEPKNLVVKSDKFTVTIRLIDGEYPPYRKVIPPEIDSKIKVERGSFIRALRRVATLASDKHKGIILKVAPGSIEASIAQSDIGTAQDAIDIEYEGEEFEVLVNVYYLLEALNIIDTDFVNFEFNVGGLPIVMRPEPAKDYFNLVMPMRK